MDIFGVIWPCAASPWKVDYRSDGEKHDTTFFTTVNALIVTGRQAIGSHPDVLIPSRSSHNLILSYGWEMMGDDGRLALVSQFRQAPIMSSRIVGI